MTKPNRIVSLISSATEILYGLGLGDRVVAVSHECDFPPEVAEKPRVTVSHIDDAARSGAIGDQVQQKVQAGEPLYGIDVAAIAQLAPDLIVTQAQCDVCAVKYDDVVAAVDRINPREPIPIVSLNPMSLDDVFRDIARVGCAADCADEAELYVATLRSRVSAVQETLANLPPGDRPRTALIEWIEPTMLAGNWMPELLRLAGGHCDLTEAGRHSAYTSWSDIAKYDPEVIVVCPCGFDLDRTLDEAQILSGFEGWSEITAVRQSRVFAVDGNAYFNRSGPRIVDSLEILAHLLHPDRFAPPIGSDSAFRIVPNYGP
jgi:iron complex transport system substrate-binding protein